MSVWEKPQIILHIHKSVNYTVYDTKWIPSSAKCVVLGSKPRGTGAIQIYEIDKGELKLMKEVSYPIAFEDDVDIRFSRLKRNLLSSAELSVLVLYSRDI